MTHNLITNDPGTAAHSAKNVHAAPGLPTNPRNDTEGRNPMLATVTRGRELAASRRRVARALAQARAGMQAWTDLVRQEAQARVGSVESAKVLDDPAYWDAVVVWAQFRDAITAFEATAARIEAGEER
jgi:hypothetical protein